MIDFETIQNEIKDYLYIGDIKAYKDDKNSGIIVSCGMQEASDKSIYRLFVFESIEKLREFIKLYVYMWHHKKTVKLEIEGLDSFIPQYYRFVKDGKEFTVNDIEREKSFINSIKQEYISSLKKAFLVIENKIAYLKFINSLDINPLENIAINLEKSILNIPPSDFEFDEKMLEMYTFKPSDTCSINFNYSDIQILEDGSPVLSKFSEISEKTELHTQFLKNTVLLDAHNTNSFYKYVENEEKYKKIKMYIEKIKYLFTLNKNSKIWILLNRKSIKTELKNISNKYSFLSEEEIHIYADKLESLYSYFKEKQSEFKIFDPYYLDDLVFVKLCIGATYEEGKENINSYYKNVLTQNSEYLKKQENKNQAVRNDIANKKRIYLDLVQQFEASNLTYEERMAILAYNSALFLIINIITSIENYENMSEDEIKNVLSDQFRKVLNLSEMYYPKGCDATIFYFQGILRQPYSSEQSEFGKYIKDIVFDEHYIQRILDVIKVLNNIRCDIVLPEDIIVYRCISTDNPSEKPTIGSFLSTSLSLEAAKNYYQTSGTKKPVMYKIKLKKGTPISAVFPQKVINTGSGKTIVDDLTSKNPVMEIMLNMNDYEIEPGSIRQHSVYNYSNNSKGELRKYQDYIVYEMTIVPKRELLEKYETTLQDGVNKKI